MLAPSHRLVGWLVLAVSVRSLANEPSATVDFHRDIRPLLSDKCFYCHGPDDKHREAELRLDTRDGLFAKRSGKTVVVPGKPAESELVRRITHADPDQRMPPADAGKSLNDSQIALLSRWIEQGATWSEHWAFSPPRRPAIPALQDAAWPVNEVDRFILSRLEREKLRPAPDAEPATLVRRLYFDLLGLPPPVADVEAFAADPSPAAYTALVDRLLESPHHAERLAMHWLDLVRYADTVGYHGDQEHAITPYRDYVIQAFRDNLPFDRFTREQLAGDLLPEPTLDQRIATGYNRLLQTSHEGGVQQKEYLAKYSADRVRNLSSVWLGLTLACSECHSHKYDPFPQTDFYRLAAFFADVDDSRTFKGGDTTPTKRDPELEVLSGLDRERIAGWERELTQLGDVPRAAELRQRIEAARKQTRRTMITVSVSPRPIRVLPRGDWLDESGPVVEPGVPQIFPQVATTGRATRLDLANWLVSPENPLTARVFVNRLWKLHFGKGLSSRLDDLGSQGEPPVHPELLDWLAVEFRESGWNVRHMIRLLVLSRTYRQSSQETPALRRLDPENRLLARQSRPRLDAEFVRDNALAISGLLVRTIGGRSARPYQPDGYYQHLNFPKRTYKADTDEHQYRRGLYTHWQRAYLHPMLKAFDAPSREECTAERAVSNTPLAALVLLNDPTFVEAARAFASRILREGGDSLDSRIRWAWREKLSRSPTDQEASVLRRVYEAESAAYRADIASAKQLLTIGLSSMPSDLDAAELAAWTSVARALFNLNETVTRN